MNLEKIDLYSDTSRSTKEITVPNFADIKVRQVAFKNPKWSSIPDRYNYICISYDQLVTLQNTINVMIEEQKQLYTLINKLEQKIANNYNELRDAITYIPDGNKYHEAKVHFEDNTKIE